MARRSLPATSHSSKRAKYSREQKDLVRQRYPLCRTLEDKEQLARELGMDSLHKLYNLASRLRVTRSFDEWSAQAGIPDDDTHGPDYQAATDPARLRIREGFSPDAFSADDDAYISRNFGRQTLGQIAFQTNHTESAILYRTRTLGLRRVPRHIDASHVIAWLGLDDGDLPRLRDEGWDIITLVNARGRHCGRLVTTTSLGRWMLPRLRELLDGPADEFFVRDIMESVAHLKARETGFEACRWLSGEHTCLNPLASNSFGLFCARTDRHEAGADPKCLVRDIPAEDLPGAR